MCSRSGMGHTVVLGLLGCACLLACGSSDDSSAPNGGSGGEAAGSGGSGGSGASGGSSASGGSGGIAALEKCDMSAFGDGASAVVYDQFKVGKPHLGVWVSGGKLASLDGIACTQLYHKTYSNLCDDVYQCGSCYFGLSHYPSTSEPWTLVLVNFFKQDDSSQPIMLTNTESCYNDYGQGSGMTATYVVKGTGSSGGGSGGSSGQSCGYCKPCYDACSSACTGMYVPASCSVQCMGGCDKCCHP